MKQAELNPWVRFFNKVIGAPYYVRMLCAYDFRLFYIVKGVVNFEFRDSTHRLEAGDLITIRPGRPYKLTFDAGETEYYLLNFDFTSEHAGIPARSPLGEKDFEEKDVISAACLPPFEDLFVARRCESLLPLFEEMDGVEEQELLRSALLKTVLAKVMIRSRSGGDLIREVKAYIYRNADTALTNLAVAKRFGYHPHYLNSIFLEAQGCTLHQYIVDARLRRAKEKLNLTEKTVAEIAREMGFKDGSYFSAFFKKAAGMTPKEYRHLCR